MSNILKDIAVLLFSAGEEIERKAEEFKKEREERYNKFEETIKEKSEKVKSSFEEEINRAKYHFSGFTDKLGIASKSEIDELRKKLDELSQKIDNMGSQ